MIAADLTAFDDVNLWIFDLDNTLYPRPETMWQQVHDKMQGYIIDLLGVEQPEAASLQTEYFQKYGLTMRGLMLHHGVEPDAFNAYVHDVDISEIRPNPDLGTVIANLPGRKVIHSNANREHAQNVLGRIGIAEAFDDIYDISTSRYIPKPAQSAYDRVLEETGGESTCAAMFEDMAHNLVVPHALGMRCVFVPTSCDWASLGSDDEHVHFVAEDLTEFVQAIAQRRTD